VLLLVNAKILGGKGMPDNEIDLTIVVNGQPTVVRANKNAPLRTVIPRALEQTGNAGQPVDNWELRDSAGALLNLDQKIGDFHFPPNVRLFLNLKAGVGGANQ
jgi:hypothetical protein